MKDMSDYPQFGDSDAGLEDFEEPEGDEEEYDPAEEMVWEDEGGNTNTPANSEAHEHIHVDGCILDKDHAGMCEVRPPKR